MQLAKNQGRNGQVWTRMDKWAWHRHEVSHAPIKKENPARSGLIAIDVVISPIKKSPGRFKKKPADMLKKRRLKRIFNFLWFKDEKGPAAFDNEIENIQIEEKTYGYEKQRIAKKFMDKNLYRC